MRKSKYVFLKSVKPSRAVAQTYGRDIQYYIKAMVRDYGVLLGIYNDKRGQLTGDADVHKLIYSGYKNAHTVRFYVFRAN